MARLARVVIPGLLYHVTQRANGGQKVFFSDSDQGSADLIESEEDAAATSRLRTGESVGRPIGSEGWRGFKSAGASATPPGHAPDG
jgi:hypothetical protein